MMIGDRIGAVLFGLSVLWLIATWIERSWGRFGSRWVFGTPLMVLIASISSATTASIGGDFSAPWFAGSLGVQGLLVVACMICGSRRAGLGIESEYPDWGSMWALSGPLALAGLLCVGLPEGGDRRALVTVLALLVPPIMVWALWAFLAPKRALLAVESRSAREPISSVSIALLVLGWLLVSLGAAWWTLLVPIAIVMIVAVVSEFEQWRAGGVSVTGPQSPLRR